LGEVEKIYKRALGRRKNILRLNGTLTLETVNNLGILYAGQSKLEEAEKIP
jgi:hypothetical protein